MHMFGDLVLIYYPTLLKTRKVRCEFCDCVEAGEAEGGVGCLRVPVVKTPTIANQLTNHIYKIL